MPGDPFDIKKGGPAPIPERPDGDDCAERSDERKHAAGLAREKAGREGRNDPYLQGGGGQIPGGQPPGQPGGSSKQAQGDAASGPDRTPSSKDRGGTERG